jgi:hypothetical protein
LGQAVVPSSGSASSCGNGSIVVIVFDEQIFVTWYLSMAIHR